MRRKNNPVPHVQPETQAERRPTTVERSKERIGLIAGSGRFPIIFAENVRRLGFSVSAIAHIGETTPELEEIGRAHV